MKTTIINLLASIGAIHLLFDFAIVAFLAWFTYDTRKVQSQLDEDLVD